MSSLQLRSKLRIHDGWALFTILLCRCNVIRMFFLKILEEWISGLWYNLSSRWKVFEYGLCSTCESLLPHHVSNIRRVYERLVTPYPTWRASTALMSPEKGRVLKRRHTKTQDDISQDGKDSKMKRPKSDNLQQVENPQPTNKVLPVHISFPPRAPDALRIATWNVCGLAASQKKVFVYLDLACSPIQMTSPSGL